MWTVRVTLKDGNSFQFQYDDAKDYKAWQKFWRKGSKNFTIEYLGCI